MYRVELISDPNGAYTTESNPAPAIMSESQLRFSLDSDVLDCVEEVARGNGVAYVEDELSGAKIRITEI